MRMRLRLRLGNLAKGNEKCEFGLPSTINQALIVMHVYVYRLRQRQRMKVRGRERRRDRETSKRSS